MNTNAVIIVAILGGVAIVALQVYRATRPPAKTALERNLGAVTGLAKIIGPFFI